MKILTKITKIFSANGLILSCSPSLITYNADVPSVYNIWDPPGDLQVRGTRAKFEVGEVFDQNFKNFVYKTVEAILIYVF